MRFEEKAAFYDQYATPQREFAALVAGFLQAPAGTAVIEFGAGTGALTRHLCAAGLCVTATDAAASMVELGARGAPKAKWQVLDAFSGAVPRSRYQASSGLLQWAADPVAVVTRWRDALERGGRMVHAFPCEPCLKEWRSVTAASPIQWRTAREWEAIFVAAGSRVERTATWERRHVFSDAMELARAMHESGVTGAPRMGPGELRQAIRRYNEWYRTADGVEATWAWMAIEARPA